MTKTPPIYTSLRGQLLVATPQMDYGQFQQSVIYICQHDGESTMGLIINQQIDDLNFGDLAEKLEIGTPRDAADMPLYIGGPVERSRGYILHSQEQMMPDSIAVSDDIALSLHLDILQDIAQGIGPSHAKIIIGYAGWSAGQLENELRENMWFHIPATPQMVFSEDSSTLWDMAFKLAGLDAGALSPQTGRA